MQIALSSLILPAVCNRNQHSISTFASLLPFPLLLLMHRLLSHVGSSSSPRRLFIILYIRRHLLLPLLPCSRWCLMIRSQRRRAHRHTRCSHANLGFRSRTRRTSCAIPSFPVLTHLLLPTPDSSPGSGARGSHPQTSDGTKKERTQRWQSCYAQHTESTDSHTHTGSIQRERRRHARESTTAHLFFFLPPLSPLHTLHSGS